jgi:hypothetical protein
LKRIIFGQKKGIYEIKVKAKDINNLISDWSDPLIVTIARYKAVNTPFLNFLKKYLNLFPILKYLVGK